MGQPPGDDLAVRPDRGRMARSTARLICSWFRPVQAGGTEVTVACWSRACTAKP